MADVPSPTEAPNTTQDSDLLSAPTSAAEADAASASISTLTTTPASVSPSTAAVNPVIPSPPITSTIAATVSSLAVASPPIHLFAAATEDDLEAVSLASLPKVQETNHTSDSCKDTDTAAPMVAANTSSPSSSFSEPNANNALLRPTKSALKQQRTRTQVFDELRAFTLSPQYMALTRALTMMTLPSSSSTALATLSEGSQSEPISPVSTIGPAFLLPIFPAPTKYHFRSHDRRRASFPKSASHPSRLNINVNVNLNLNMSVHMGPGHSGEDSTCDNSLVSSPLSSSSSKQLRFSLEVQELVFLPTSPPFRISRAKPTRAHSDPAIQTATCSSFIAPSNIPSCPRYVSSTAATAQAGSQSSNPQGSMISTATASASSFENTATTFIKVQAHDGTKSSSNTARLYLQTGDEDEDDEDASHCHFSDDFHDEYLFEDCREGHELDEDEEEEDDEYNGTMIPSSS
ncbi:hypothetical protein EDD11_002887 [Mortierella claussenii]|nr:hypothetical protein EDD11_002887 [Mortierella claussenii]